MFTIGLSKDGNKKKEEKIGFNEDWSREMNLNKVAYVTG